MMQDRRSKLKRHIHAAKEWLGEAEDELEKSQDVKGNLKFMLAAAELQHARETEKNAIGKYVHFLSFITACAFAAVFLWGQPTEEAVLQTEVQPVENERQEEAPQLPVFEESALQEAVEQKGEAYAASSMQEELSNEKVSAVSEDTVPSRKESQEIKEKQPTEEMQKLMQFAGKVLRADQ